MLKIFLKIFSLSLTKHPGAEGAEGIEISGVKSNACECLQYQRHNTLRWALGGAKGWEDGPRFTFITGIPQPWPHHLRAPSTRADTAPLTRQSALPCLGGPTDPKGQCLPDHVHRDIEAYLTSRLEHVLLRECCQKCSKYVLSSIWGSLSSQRPLGGTLAGAGYGRGWIPA